MTTTPSEAATSVLGELILGRARWDLLKQFPTQDPEDRQRGDDAIHAAVQLVSGITDVDAVEATRRIPGEVFEQLRARGLYSLQTPHERGGLGLTPYNTFRVIHAVAGHSVPIAVSLAIDTGFGAASYLPFLSDGALKTMITDLDAAGFISGDADTEPMGAANRRRTTTAVLDADGEYYVLNGEKVFIGNGPLADLLRVSATVPDDDGESIGLFFVPTNSRGLCVGEIHDFVGFRGAPIAPVRLNEVRVPRAWRFLPNAGMSVHEEWKLNDDLTDISIRARMFAIGAPSLAIAQSALRHARRFITDRTVDGCGLASYSAIQRMLADTAAEIFAIQAVAEWCLIPANACPAALRREQTAAKNLFSVTCWRIVDRVMTLHAAQGLETADSQRRRRLPGHSMQQLWRDARMLRISGGVDYRIDIRFAVNEIVSAFLDEPNAAEPCSVRLPLNGRNGGHQEFIASEAAWFAQTCRTLIAGYPDPADLTEEQDLMMSLGRLAMELFIMSLALAKAECVGDGDSALLADVYCDSARSRVAELHQRITNAEDVADHRAVSDGLLSGNRFTTLTGAHS